MKGLGAYLLACAVVVSQPGPEGSAGWGAAFCSPPVGGFARQVVTPKRYTWQNVDNNTFILFEYGTEIGRYDWATDLFTPNGRPPTAPPWGARRPEAAQQNFGVDWGRIHTDRESCSLNGRPATRAECIAAIEAAQLRDDSGLPRLTIIGSKEDRAQVLKDWATHPSLAPYRDRYVVTAYNPDDWHVSRYGFVCTGKPTIYVQASGQDATTLHRQDCYESGPEGLARALRKLQPDYDPSKDRDRRKPDLLPVSLPDWLKNPLVWGAGIVLLVVLFVRPTGGDRP